MELATPDELDQILYEAAWTGTQPETPQENRAVRPRHDQAILRVVQPRGDAMTIGATAAWTQARPGRPRKNAATPAGTITPKCIWPVHSDVCGKPRLPGFAVCTKHAPMLEGGPGKTCAWPGCNQHPIATRVCTYHDKRARALLTGGR